jgi:hypothetical protein
MPSCKYYFTNVIKLNVTEICNFRFKYFYYSESLGLWTSYIIRNYNYKTQRFSNWICFSLQLS